MHVTGLKYIFNTGQKKYTWILENELAKTFLEKKKKRDKYTKNSLNIFILEITIKPDKNRIITNKFFLAYKNVYMCIVLNFDSFIKIAVLLLQNDY